MIDGITISPEYVRGLLQRIKDLEAALRLAEEAKELRKFIENYPKLPTYPIPPVTPWHGGMCACGQCTRMVLC